MNANDGEQDHPYDGGISGSNNAHGTEYRSHDRDPNGFVGYMMADDGEMEGQTLPSREVSMSQGGVERYRGHVAEETKSTATSSQRNGSSTTSSRGPHSSRRSVFVEDETQTLDPRDSPETTSQRSGLGSMHTSQRSGIGNLQDNKKSGQGITGVKTQDSGGDENADGANDGNTPRNAQLTAKMSRPTAANLKRLTKSQLNTKKFALQTYAWNYFTVDHAVRQFCLNLYYNIWFDRTVFTIILINCVFLAMIDPTSGDSATRNQISSQSSLVFTILFTIEMLIKMTALGVFGENSYFGDKWNWLDFLVVFVGYVSIMPAMDNLSTIRTLRVLRPLRALQAAPVLRTVVGTMLASLPALCNVLYFAIFGFFFYSIIGNQLYQGVLRGRCFYEHPETGVKSPLEGEICGLSCDAFKEDGARCSPNQGNACTEQIIPIQYSNGSREIMILDTECRVFQNPEDGNAGFDNFGMSVLTVFVSMTLEGWVEFYYDLNAGFGLDYINAIYFIFLVITLPYLVLNLTLAVVWDEYTKADAKRQEYEKQLHSELLGDDIISVEDEDEEQSPNSSPNRAREISLHSQDDDDGRVGCTTESIKVMNKRWRKKAKHIARSNWLELTAGTFIVLNTLALAVEHFNMPNWLDILQDWINIICTFAFAVEMGIKLYGLGWRRYLDNKFNIFDGTIVIASIVEMIVRLTLGPAVPGISVLRTFRVFRTFRVARAWKPLNRLLRAIVRSVAGVAYASLVLFIFVFVYVLLGMQIFGGGWPEGERPRPHFDNFWWATVTTFQVLSTEDWDDVVYDYMPEFGPAASVLYSVSLIIVGNYIIMNLFLAILLSNFDDEDEDNNTSTDNPKEEPDNSADQGKSQADGAGYEDPCNSNNGEPSDTNVDERGNKFTSQDKGGSHAHHGEVLRKEEGASPEMTPLGASDYWTFNGHSPDLARLKLKYKVNRPTLDATFQTPNGTQEELKISHTGDVVRKSELDFGNPEAFDIDKVYGNPRARQHYSFFLFAPDSVIRRWCSKIISHKFFERFILLVIIYSSLLLAVEEPDVRECREDDSCPTLSQFLRVSEIVVVVIFVIEVAMKSIARGFILEEHAYLRNGWDILDFIVVIISVFSVLAVGSSDSVRSLRALRTVRALRPLRIIRRFFGMRLVINAVIGSMPRVSSVILVNILFMLIFAVVGVQQWMGSMYRCNDPDIDNKDDCVGTFMLQNELCRDLPTEEQIRECRLKVEGAEFERVWEPLDQNFDNVLNAILTVFEVATNELWPEIMFNTVDATEPGEGLKRENNPAAALWFILVQLMFNFFMLEVFTGVVVDYYQGLRQDSQGSGILTVEQSRWVASIQQMATSGPKTAMKRPSGRCSGVRNMCYSIASNYYFDMFIMSCIALNVLFMSMRHYGMSDRWLDFQTYSNILFVTIFATEAVIKILGFGVCQYFSIRWNQFDFVIAVVGLAGLGSQVGGIAAFFRVFRVLRLFRLIRSSSVLRQMFKTLLLSIPAMLNILTVVALVIFIYSVVGMNVYSDVRLSRTLDFHNDDANFRSFWVSAMTLFRTTTGEDWNGIMHDLMIRPPFCVDGENCGDQISPPLYFCSYVMVTTYVLMNLLVAVVLNNFLETSVEEEDESKPFVLTQELVVDFQRQWAVFDPWARNRISKFHHIVALVATLPYPLGLDGHPALDPKRPTIAQARRLLLHVEIPLYREEFTFHAVLQALVHNARSLHWKSSVIPPDDARKSDSESLLEMKVKKHGKAVTSRDAAAREIIQDLVYRWKYSAVVKRLTREWGRKPTYEELVARGYRTPDILSAKYIRAVIRGATRKVHKEHHKGFRRYIDDVDFIHVPALGVGIIDDEELPSRCGPLTSGERRPPKKAEEKDAREPSDVILEDD